MEQRKPYNPNSKYGRKKLRDQAAYNYQHGTPEYRKDIDNIKAVVVVMLLVIIVIVFVVTFLTSGEKAAIKMLK
jgi:hypothetical protein